MVEMVQTTVRLSRPIDGERLTRRFNFLKVFQNKLFLEIIYEVMPSKVSNHCSSMFKMSAGVSIIIKLSVFVADAAEKN
jgi:hypothetical protein